MTVHRTYGHVDRASLGDGAPLRVVMATEGRKADGIDLRMAGADLARFRTNPVLGYGHHYAGRENLPIGRVKPDTISVNGGSISAEIEFDQSDEFARTIERKMRDGYLNAVSIGFSVTKWENDRGNYWDGGVAESWELSELSVVPVPMDSDAVVSGGRAALEAIGDRAAGLAEVVSRAVAAMSALNDALASTHLPEDPGSTPPPQVAATEAREFLAALKMTERETR